jgi:ADP-ribosylglycohydrolase
MSIVKSKTLSLLPGYAERLYAGLLGKVIGVYMGRPFEGWPKAKIEEKWGAISRYVHEDMGKPLVVADDDISGTLTFIRALEDSGLYAETPAAFFGKTWLNYLIEGKTVLWWGGFGVSTEHTAYTRLKQGYEAPASGSIALNGKLVAEQIGAQIFIDGCGLVAPGRPDLAAELARRAASVSHDGEAIHAAVVQAAMVAAAFTQRDMRRIIDLALAQIPAKSLIARLHADVRKWAGASDDWRRTYDRIAKNYGYDKFGGGCHVIPNHALMVLAWLHAPDDFFLSQQIINTAGWDTDCNAANVGCVMGVKVGLAGINARYDFQVPPADRIILPTAEGTRSSTDVLIEASHLERIGRVVMGWPAPKKPKDGAWHHFDMPGALHGYRSEDGAYETRGAAAVSNVPAPRGLAGRAMRIAFDVSAGRTARISTPVLPTPPETPGGYRIEASPHLYPGMTVTAAAQVGQVEGAAHAKLFIRCGVQDGKVGQLLGYGPAQRLRADKPLRLSIELPADLPWPAWDLGIQIDSAARAAGDLFIDRISLAGRPNLRWPDALPILSGIVAGWVSSVHAAYPFGVESGQPATAIGQNAGRGLLVTGNADWADYTFSAKLSIKVADLAGLVVRHQGLERYIALVKIGEKMQLLRRWYGSDEILAEAACPFADHDWHALSLEVRSPRITARCDGRQLLAASDDRLARGGAGFLCEVGRISVRSISLKSR